MRKFGCSNTSGDRPRSLKQVVIAPMLKFWQQIWVSRILVDDHYTQMHRVTVSSIGQNLQPFTGYCDISIWVTVIKWDEKHQTNKSISSNSKISTTKNFWTFKIRRQRYHYFSTVYVENLVNDQQTVRPNNISNKIVFQCLCRTYT